VESPRGYQRTGENRFREVVGFCYEDLVVGMVIEHRPGRTVTEMDNSAGTTSASPSRCSSATPCTNADGDVVLTFDRTFLVPTRDNDLHSTAGY